MRHDVVLDAVKREAQSADSRLDVRAVIAHLEEVVEHGRLVGYECPEAAQELTAARRNEHGQQPRRVGEPRLTVLQHVVQRDQVEVVIGVKV